MSASVNKVIILGRLGKDPEKLSGGFNNVPHCRLIIATNDPAPNKGEVTSWHSVSCFGQTAHYALEYVRKGALVLVEARLSYGSYTARNGEKIYTTDIKAVSIQQLSYPSGNDGDEAPVDDLP